MLVMIKVTLYEGTVALCASMDLGKGFGTSEPTKNAFPKLAQSMTRDCIVRMLYKDMY